VAWAHHFFIHHWTPDGAVLLVPITTINNNKKIISVAIPISVSYFEK